MWWKHVYARPVTVFESGPVFSDQFDARSSGYPAPFPLTLQSRAVTFRFSSLRHQLGILHDPR